MFYTFYWSERKTPFKLLYIEKVPIMLHTYIGSCVYVDPGNIVKTEILKMNLNLCSTDQSWYLIN